MNNITTPCNARLKLCATIFSVLLIFCALCAFPATVQGKADSAEITGFTITPNAKT